ncbi:MAG: hypothetical protein EBX50_22160, partial [Chitinophagia bacterium]|nr:hypothetical protein [Chitinophagia bacterium]
MKNRRIMVNGLTRQDNDLFLYTKTVKTVLTLYNIVLAWFISLFGRSFCQYIRRKDGLLRWPNPYRFGFLRGN